MGDGECCRDTGCDRDVVGHGWGAVRVRDVVGMWDAAKSCVMGWIWDEMGM